MNLSQVINTDKVIISQSKAVLDGNKKLMPIYEEIFENIPTARIENEDLESKSDLSKGFNDA